MKKQIIILSTLFLLAGCKPVDASLSNSESLKQESDSSTNQETSPSLPEYDGSVSLENGFENEDAYYVFDCLSGTKKEINDNPSKVLTGKKSLKIMVSEFADATFRFNENVQPTNITSYEYLSFWMYIDYEGTFGLSNSCLSSSSVKQYINGEIKGKEWTKIVIDKNSSVFDIIQYNVSFNNFIISGTGNNYGKVLDYSFYIDDVRVYKEGMAGECTMLFKMDDSTYTSKMDDVECGVEKQIPEIAVYSPLGYAIYGADAQVKKKIVDEDGKEIAINNNQFRIDEIGTYTLISTYEHDGIDNVFSSTFDVVLGRVCDLRMGVAYVNEEYEIPSIAMTRLNSDEPMLFDVSVDVKDAKNERVPLVNNTILAQNCGTYDVNYTICKEVNGVMNRLLITKKLYVNDTHGVIADFSNKDFDLFKINTLSVAGSYVENEEYKINKNENKGSYKFVVANEGGVSFSFNQNFPYESIEEFNYLSFWVYSESNVALTLETSVSNKKVILNPQTWTLARFTKDEISGPIGDMEVIIYDAINKEKINCNFYVDDIRLLKSTDPEEVLFSSNVTTEDFNEVTKEGRLYSANYQYEIDLSLYDVNGNKLSENATIQSIVDKRNKTIEVKDGKYFTPTTVGKHTILLTYEKDGIISSSKKIITVTEQMLLSPFEKFMLTPAEQNKTYTFNQLPELWNYGVIDSSTNIDILIYDELGNEVIVQNRSFTPTTYGKYSVFFVAKDTKIPSSSALLEASLLVFQEGKYGVVCDFEDQSIEYMESTTYYYGDVSDFFISTKQVHGGNYSAVFYNLSDETKEMKFSLNDKNPIGDISNTNYVSFWIYIEDEENNTYKMGKTAYAGWINETDASYVVGSLNVSLQSNKWIEIKIERKDYEKVLGGTIFAGQTVGAGGSYWAAANNDYITTFSVMLPNYGQISKNVKIYIDDFTLGY